MVPYCGATQLERVSPIGTLSEIIYFQGLFILKLCRIPCVENLDTDIYFGILDTRLSQDIVTCSEL